MNHIQVTMNMKMGSAFYDFAIMIYDFMNETNYNNFI